MYAFFRKNVNMYRVCGKIKYTCTDSSGKMYVHYFAQKFKNINNMYGFFNKNVNMYRFCAKK